MKDCQDYKVWRMLSFFFKYILEQSKRNTLPKDRIEKTVLWTHCNLCSNRICAEQQNEKAYNRKKGKSLLNF